MQIRTFLTFTSYFGLTPLPASLQTTLVYLQFLSRSFSTSQSIRNYLNGVKFLHSMVGLNFPHLDHFLVKLTLRGLARIIDTPPKHAKPMTSAILLSFLPYLNLSIPLHATLWAAFLVAFFTFARLSNIVPDSTDSFDITKQFARADFISHPDHLLVLFKWSKTNQFHSHVTPVPLSALPGSPLCPVVAFDRMVRLVPAPKLAPAFCLLTQPERLPLSRGLFLKSLASLILRTGLSPKGFTGHSFRRGGATCAFGAGVPGELIKQHGQWRSDAYLRYLD